MRKRAGFSAIVILLVVMFLGLLLVSLGAVGYPTAKALVDPLSRDGDLESFREDLYSLLRLPLLGVGVSLVVLGGLGLSFADHSRVVLVRFQRMAQNFWRKLRQDAAALGADLPLNDFLWWEWALLAVLVLAALAGRWIWLDRPVAHDESYTFIAFAQQPLWRAIGDYHLPNNHLLNTILVHALYRLFGNPSPIVMRLPSLLAGVACVPLAYLWARQQRSKAGGWIAAALIAVYPWLKFQSTNGRGYLLMAMFTLLVAILSELVRRRKNRAAWVLLALVTMANFYTLPIALYPFVIFHLWLALSAAVGDIDKGYGGFWKFLRYLIACVALSGLGTFILYLPVFTYGTGWRSFFQNPFVSRLNWYDFTQTLPVRLSEALLEWQMDLPGWFLPLVGLGLAFSLLLHWKEPKGIRARIPVQLAALLALTLVFLVQRPNPWTRIWTYLVPLLLVWAGMGYVMLVRSICKPEKIRAWVVSGLTGGMVAALLAFGAVHGINNLQFHRGEMGQEETLTFYLQGILCDDDLVLASTGTGTQFWYYFDRHHLPMNTIVHQSPYQEGQTVYFIVDRRENQEYLELTASSVVPPSACPQEVTTLMHEYGNYTIYRCSTQPWSECAAR